MAWKGEQSQTQAAPELRELGAGINIQAVAVGRLVRPLAGGSDLQNHFGSEPPNRLGPAMKAWLVLWCLSRAQECQDGCGAQFLQLKTETQLTEHPWPHARGRIPLQDGTTPETVSTGQKNWSWHDPLGPDFNLLAGGAVIDKDGNVFQNTQKGLHAFSRQGDKLWFYDTPGMSNNEVTLYGDLVLGTTETGNAFALERTTGQPRWITKLAEDAGPDCGYPAAAEGIFVVGSKKGLDPRISGGNQKVMGLNVHNGDKLWEYEPDLPVWNLTPLFVGDGSVVFMDFAGGTYRLNLTSGEAIWRNLPADSRRSFSDGGAGLGPNNMIYTCSNPGANAGWEGSTGIVRAFHLVSGSEAWHYLTEFPCNSYPSIGKLAGVESLAVVVTPGSFMGPTNLHGSILALDAESGQALATKGKIHT